jgi:hypothetical protein
MVSGNQGMSFDAMTWTRRFNEFDPSDTSVPRFFGVRGEGAEPQVSVRARILSLTRFGIAAGALEKGCAAYGKQNGLDLYGKIMASPPTKVDRCVHPQGDVPSE